MLSVEGNVRRYLETSCYGHPSSRRRPIHVCIHRIAYFGNQDLGELFAKVTPSVPAQYQSPYRAE